MALWHQRIVDPVTGGQVGLEILLHHAKEVLEITHSAGTLVETEQYILREAWKRARSSPQLLVFVNVTAETMAAERLPFWPEDSPRNLVLELTESRSFDAEKVERWLFPYREQGLQVALDDFGTGFNQFERCSYLRPDFLKINWMGHEETMRAALSFAKEMLSRVILERVATERQAEWAKRQSVGLVQGYFYHRPEPLSPSVVMIP
ncbi:EAL domain-containing protein [Alicyclobacillus tolerans]|uniref:EAL domain-containing protein n=1 Tax=Alicyclobacillus TaxID=29330 RepID=UPI00093441D8|nr:MULTISPECIES: EAL domain-containing protein [Alicyclobacillus]